MKVKFAYGIAPGAVSGGKERRDNIRTAYGNGVGAIFLAGPAAGIAAELTTERFDELYASESGFIKDTLSGSKTDGSLLFAAVKGNRYLAGHLGGGLIAKLDESCSILSEPEEWNRDELRIYRGEVQGPFGFLLMSDAACRSLYEIGGEKLSPACGTFFEWLKEYDEETVSEAVTDNINKYFVKNVKGDISVGLMVSDESGIEEEFDETAPPEEFDETAPPEEAPETDEPVAELPETTEPELTEITEPKSEPAVQSRKGSIIKYLIAAVVIVAIIFVFAMKPGASEPNDEAKPETKAPVTSSENTNTSPPAVDGENDFEGNEPVVTFSVDDPATYNAGAYQVGEDIPAGEYFFWTGEMLKPDSIKVNDVTCLSGELYCLTVKVGQGDTLTTDVRFTAAENVESVKAANGTLISGKYRIGKDIEPGTYSLSTMDPDAEGKYYSILNGEISNDEVFSGETTVKVPDEGYIVFYNSVLTVSGQ